MSNSLLFFLYIGHLYVDALCIGIVQNLKTRLELFDVCSKQKGCLCVPHRQTWANLFSAFRNMMFSTDMGLWTIFCSADVIKSTFESWELLLMPLSLMLSQENDLPEFFSIPLSLTYALRFVSFLLSCNLWGTPLLKSPQIYRLFFSSFTIRERHIRLHRL